MKPLLKFYRHLLAAIAVFGTANSTSAIEKTFVENVGNDWGLNNNWVPFGVPSVSDAANIRDNTVPQINFDVSTISLLRVADNLDGQFDINPGGFLTVDQQAFFGVSGTGQLAMVNQTADAYKWWMRCFWPTTRRTRLRMFSTEASSKLVGI